VLLAFALSAAATYFGALEPYRVWLMQHTSVELSTADSAIAAVAGLPHWLGPTLIAILCLIGIMMLGNVRNNARLLTAGSVIGLLVVAGWFITGYLSVDDFTEHRASSVTIAGPLARVTVFLTTGSVPGYGFTIAVLVGIVLGAMSSAIVTRSFHLVIPEGYHLKHLLVGGVLMGIGAICAGGCNIGAGLTGMSTTSVRAVTALVAIVAGMLLGIYLLTRTEKVDTRAYHHHRHIAGA